MTLMQKSVVRQLLVAGPKIEGWSLQGFGMLRLYLDKEGIYRLHVWDARYAVKDVSAAHDHPWDFTSYIIAGSIVDQRFFEVDAHDPNGMPFLEQKIKCGPGGGLCEEKPRELWLQPSLSRRYGPGENYTARAEEVHCSHPVDGTVTIIERSFREDTEHARVVLAQGDRVGERRAAPRIGVGSASDMRPRSCNVVLGRRP